MSKKYELVITKQVEKFIKKQDKPTQIRVIKAVKELPEGDVKKLKGYEKFYRLRVGDIRIIFEKKDDEYIIILIDIGNRGQIYNKYSQFTLPRHHLIRCLFSCLKERRLGRISDNFGFKIGIEGEREFKNSLRDINQSFKVLDSEMNLVTSQFDRQDKSLQAMTARNNVLSKGIDAQKNKVSSK